MEKDISKFKTMLTLVLSMLKIGLFTFGGGYAMISLLENEFVSKRKWIGAEEFLDLVAIAESTPGPISINCSTYIGYKVGKFWGAVLSTLAICIPSFVIIFIISLYFNQFLELEIVAKAFKGIQVAVIFLILSAGIKMLKKLEKNAFNIIIFVATMSAMILLNLFAISFSSIFYILISGILGLLVYLIGGLRKKKNVETNDKEVDE